MADRGGKKFDPNRDLKLEVREAKANAKKDRKELMSMAKKKYGLKKTPKRLPSETGRVGHPVGARNQDIYVKLAVMVRNVVDENGNSHWWCARSIAKYIKSKLLPGETHYSEKYPFCFCARFAQMFQLRVLTKSSIERYNFFSPSMLVHQVVGNTLDYVRLYRDLSSRGGGSPIVLGFVDEAACFLHAPQTKKLIGPVETPKDTKYPAKGTWQTASLIAGITSTQFFRLPNYWVVGSNVTNWQIGMMRAIYNNLNFSEVVERSSTHMNQDGFYQYLKSVVASWNKYRRSNSNRNVTLILCVDGASYHNTDTAIITGTGANEKVINKSQAPAASQTRTVTDYLLDQGIHIYKIRSNITSFVCPLDVFCFSELKAAIGKTWCKGGDPTRVLSLVDPDVVSVVLNMHTRYSQPQTFESLGYNLSTKPTEYDVLHSRVKEVVPKENWDRYLDEWSIRGMGLSSRGRVVAPKMISSMAADRQRSFSLPAHFMRDGRETYAWQARRKHRIGSKVSSLREFNKNFPDLSVAIGANTDAESDSEGEGT